MRSDLTRDEIDSLFCSMTNDELLAAILMVLGRKYPQCMATADGLIAVTAILVRRFEPTDKARAVESIRDMADDVERPLLAVLH
jgi:hypothetical protein